jgi:hypothetical protein
MARGKTTGKDLTHWDQQLTEQANMAAGTVSSAEGGGNFSIRGTMLTFQGNRFDNDEMAVIIADFILLNQWYDNEPFEEDNYKAPYCWAVGRDAAQIAPHEQAEDPQSESCVECKWNCFGTADIGRGKACKNGYRLACVSAGELDRAGNLSLYEDDYLEKSAFGWLNVPPTSTAAFASFVQQLQNAFKRPPHAFVAKVKVYPHPKHKMAAISFEPIMDLRKEAPNLIPVAMKRHDQATKELEAYVFTPNEEESAQPSRSQQRRQQAGRAAGREPVVQKPARPPRRQAAPEPQPAKPAKPARRLARQQAQPAPQHQPRRSRGAPSEPAANPAPGQAAGSKFRGAPR